MDEKRAERGGHYTYRELEADSGVNHSHVVLIVGGRRHPSREVVLALIRALAPYLDADQALIAAGYIPEGVPASWLRRASAWWRDGVARDAQFLEEVLRREAGGEEGSE